MRVVLLSLATDAYNVDPSEFDATPVHAALNEYGNISKDAKNNASIILQSIILPKLLVAAILCKHYEIELYKELLYYFNRAHSIVPEFKSIKISEASFGVLMNIISKTQKEYDDFNEELIKKSSISINFTKPNGEKSSKYITYDETKEKKLPVELMIVYNSVNNDLLTISVKIENANNLLDIVNLIFDNGIETRIAKDSDGIVQGGSLLNEIQETVLMICKMLIIN